MLEPFIVNRFYEWSSAFPLIMNEISEINAREKVVPNLFVMPLRIIIHKIISGDSKIN